MRIVRAKALGFCFGVRRAIDMVAEVAEERGPIDSLGSIVHNPVVVDGLKAKGVRVVGGLEDVESASAPRSQRTAAPSGPSPRPR